MMPEPSGQHPYKDAPLFDDVAFLTGALQTVLAAQTDRPLQEATRLGLIDPDPTLLRPTERGQRYLNDLLQLFL